MNPEFRVLKNAGESNSRTPIIQNRFRKLTLQSPQQPNIQPKMPEHLALPQSKLATENNINPPTTPYKSQSQTVTNKLMLSTSSGSLTETNFINVETEPFANPLQVESTESEAKPKETSGHSDNVELTLQMEKLEVSRVSEELFSQFSSTSKISLPPNRILSNKENIDNLSQRMSNIHMSDRGDLADTQPNTSSHHKQGGRTQRSNFVDDTQPNTPSQRKNQLDHLGLGDDRPIVTSIVLSSDDEENGDDGSSEQHKSLLTEESDEDDGSVIEILSSDDSISASDDPIPQNSSAINAQVNELTESVAQKLNHFFDNIPKLNESRQKLYKNAESSDSPKNRSDSSEINIPETIPSDGGKDDESNVLELQASHLNESGEVFAEKGDSQVSSSHEKEDNQKNEIFNSLPDKTSNDASLRSSSAVLILNESGKMSNVASESANRSVADEESDNTNSSHLNRDTDEKQMSIHQTKKRIQFEKIKTNPKKVNSPIISVSATVNINIRVSGFSSNSSDTDATSENTDIASQQSSKKDLSLQSEEAIDSSMELVSHCRRMNDHQSSGANSENLLVCSTTNKGTDDDLLAEQDQISLESSVIESSITMQSQGNATVESKSEEKDATPDTNDTNDSIKESTDTSNSSADVVAKESSMDGTMKAGNNDSVSATDTSVEIDEIGEQLLTDIYGDTWRTPQLIKKCLSTRKKCQTDVVKRDKSRGFSLFRQDIIHSELDSTRITPSDVRTEKSLRKEHLDQSHADSDRLLPNKEKEVNESDANESSKIIRSCRKGRVRPNRVLDYSDDDNDDDSEQSDSSFEPMSSGESDSSVEKLERPKPTRKRNKFVFLDLTCQEVIEDEDHENPDATSEQLEKVGKTFLQSLASETIVQTPAPTKKISPSITAKRKLFTPNYDDQAPFEEMKTPEPLRRDDKQKIIQLKTPIPSYLIPPQFRETPKFTEPSVPTATPSSKNSRKVQTPSSKRACGFLESLDEKVIPIEHCDPDAIKYRNNFKRNKNDLVLRLMDIYNKYVFDGKLKKVPVSWSKNLTKTAGITRLRKIGGVRIAPIELSEKVLTTADRVRDTLIHELCHSAAWIIDKELGGHGKIWKYWGSRARERFPELPTIDRCHNYDIECKYTYKCTVCGLKSKCHSKSKKVENMRCAACHGPIEVFLNKTDKDGKVTLVPPKEPSVFAKFVKEKYKLFKVSGTTHADVMKILSANFGKLTVEEKSKYKQ